jgi:HK97 family phage major capsid protein
MSHKKIYGVPTRFLVGLAIAACLGVAQACGVDVQVMIGQNPEMMAASMGLMFTGEIDAKIMQALDSVEKNLEKMSEKATQEIKDLGKVTTDTKTALDNLGTEQRVLADRLTAVEQKAKAPPEDKPESKTVGAMFVAGEKYNSFVKADARGKVYSEVKNTVTNTVGNTFSQRRPNLVEGAFRVFTLEELLTKLPATSNAIDWVRENVFTNAAAERVEGGAMGQSSLTYTPGTMPVSTVSHFIRISKQLASDNSTLAAYIDRRMIYGVNLKVETQLFAGNGAGGNISGLALAGNFTAHGYTTASLTALGLSATNRFDLIGKMIGDCAAADYPADVIILNTADWWTMRLAKDGQGRYILGDPGSAVPPTLWGLPVVASNSVPTDMVWVGNLAQAATLWDRESVGIEMSDADADNFTTGLITIRAERRLALTVEKPAAARYGDLTPA